MIFCPFDKGRVFMFFYIVTSDQQVIIDCSLAERYAISSFHSHLKRMDTAR